MHWCPHRPANALSWGHDPSPWPVVCCSEPHFPSNQGDQGLCLLCVLAWCLCTYYVHRITLPHSPASCCSPQPRGHDGSVLVAPGAGAGESGQDTCVEGCALYNVERISVIVQRESALHRCPHPLLSPISPSQAPTCSAGSPSHCNSAPAPAPPQTSCGSPLKPSPMRTPRRAHLLSTGAPRRWG